jgi:S1-C subfamily serine protease
MDAGQFPAHHSGDDTPQEPTQPDQIVPSEPTADPNGATWPSLPPVGRSGTDSTSAPRPPYEGYNPWGTGTSPSAPPPPGGAYPGGAYPGGGYYYPTGQNNQRRGASRIPAWLYMLAIAGILGGLAIGVGLGRASGLHAGAIATPSATSTPHLALGASAPPIVSVPGNTQALQTSVESVVKAVLPSVVEITSTGQDQQAIGSGDILTKDGYIVTNDHVVDGFNSFTVTLADGSNLSATLIGQAPQDDLAVLKVSATNLQPIAIGDSSKAQVGEFVVALGTPLGQRNTATFGVVSALNRVESEAPDGPAGTLNGMIQTDAPITNGNSGGALVDLKGELLGIPTLGSSSGRNNTSGTIGFAIASNRVTYVSQQLIRNGHLTSTGQGFLGIQAQDVTPNLAAANGLSVQSGVLVADLANDAAGSSPAQQAGIRQGDVIIAINGQSVSNGSDLVGALQNVAPGTTVKVTFVRGTSQQTVSVTLGERPTNAQG